MRFVSLAVGLLLVATRAGAETPTLDTCIESAEAAQLALGKSKLQQAREHAGRCIASSCPGQLRRDCAEFMTRIDAAMPSIVMSVQSTSGVDLTDAKVRLDDVVIASNGSAVEVDPGVHRLVVEAKGYTSARQTVTVRSAEKHRLINVRLVGDAPQKSSETRSPAVGTWVAAGALAVVAVAGAAVFAGFGLAGRQEREELSRECGPDCSHERRATMRQQFLIADIGLVSGIVGLVASPAVLLFGPRKQSAPPTLHGRLLLPSSQLPHSP